MRKTGGQANPKNRERHITSGGVRRYQLLGTLLICVLLLVSSLLNLQVFEATTRELEALISNNTSLVQVLYGMDRIYAELQVNLQQFLFRGKDDALASLYVDLANMKNLQTQAEYYIGLLLGAPRMSDTSFRDIAGQFSGIDTDIDQIVLLRMDGRTSEAEMQFERLQDNKLLRVRMVLNSFILSQQNEIDRTMANMGSKRNRVWMLLIVQNGVVWVALSAISFRLGDRIARPVQEIARHFHTLGTGNLDNRLEPEHAYRIREFDELAEAAEQMRERLLVSFDAITRHSVDLESKVAERTSELEMRNAEVQSAMRELRDSQGKLIALKRQEMLGQFIRSILHRINSPLGTAVLSVDILNRKLIQENFPHLLGDGVSPDVRAGIELAGTSLSRICRTMENLRNLLVVDNMEPLSEVDLPLFLARMAAGDSLAASLHPISIQCRVEVPVRLAAMNFRRLILDMMDFQHRSPMNREGQEPMLSCELVESNLLIEMPAPPIEDAPESDQDLTDYLFRRLREDEMGFELATIIITASFGMNGAIRMGHGPDGRHRLQIVLPVRPLEVKKEGQS